MAVIRTTIDEARMEARFNPGVGDGPFVVVELATPDGRASAAAFVIVAARLREFAAELLQCANELEAAQGKSVAEPQCFGPTVPHKFCAKEPTK